MELKTYLKNLGDELAREDFARRCEHSLGHLRNVAYGLKPCSAELAAAIERCSAGSVTRQEMLPGRWALIWPELALPPPPVGATLPGPRTEDWPLVKSKLHQES